MHDRQTRILFWGCFTALVTTSFAFFTRMYLCDVRFAADFALEQGTVGELKGAGVWPFAISIILFSLVIDRVGYRLAMWFSFGCYAAYMALAFAAYSAIQGVEGAALASAQQQGYQLLYWGSIILALGNGTVEAFINPVVATVFHLEKTKWLNILHAGWPGGLVLGGLLTITLSDLAATGDWRWVVALIALPALAYVAALMPVQFPKSERESAGVGYREMLAEFGAFGAAVAFGLIFGQLGQVFGWPNAAIWGLTGAIAVGFGLYTGSLGRPLMAVLIIIMMPLAITELGTDGWTTGLLEVPMAEAGFNPGWVLIYTSLIMMVLRFFAGPIVKRLTPIGLLMLSSFLAILGLYALSLSGSYGLAVIFAAATLYGVGKTFFWPTMLGVTAEQCPRGGALTLNAIAGIGMIAVGILGLPLIGALQESTASAIVRERAPQLGEQVLIEKSYVLGDYAAIDPTRVAGLSPEEGAVVAEAVEVSRFAALADMALFPTFMLACYIGLWFYFRGRGGYSAVVLTGGQPETAGRPDAAQAVADGLEGSAEG